MNDIKFSGQELTAKKVIVLLLVAALVLALLFVRRPVETANLPEEVAQTEDYLYLSPYDSLFRECADSLYDWKLLAAIAYVESKFDTTSVSHRGAVGLMQIMPSTYKDLLRKMGSCDTTLVDSLHFSTEMNIKAAVYYMHSLNDRFSFINEEERLNYVLGSYNGGSNHIFDAMRIARKRGVNRYNWNSLSTVLSRMNEEEFYTDSVCKFGEFDATETLHYVNKVQRKYHEYVSKDLLYRATNRLIENQKIE